MLTTGITTTDKTLQKKCEAIAAQYHLPFFDISEIKLPQYLLILDQEKLSLIKTDNKAIKPFYIDFCEGKMDFRRKTLSAKKDLLAKAIGIKKISKPTVLDTTAGLGRDGFLLACMGATVIMLERNPILYLLLNDGLRRFAETFPVLNAALNYQLIYTDAKTYLHSSLEKFQIIYLDPMFPARTKSALVKKDMQFLHDIAGMADDTTELFALSLQCACSRVVVKRPLHGKTLTELKPAVCYKGKAIRYDVYPRA